MLQQTRVETVIAYYQRFLQRFSTVADLAAASEDEVLHHWTGLGYYARARNLHKAAYVVQNTLHGEFPDTLEGLMRLPGIGRSTAAAILTLAMGKRAAILDGNVRRLLARFHEIEGWSGQASVQKKLWDLAEQHLPAERLADYTQAIMDLGATVCHRKRPDCAACPVGDGCRAFATGRTDELPTPKPRRRLPIRAVHLLLLENPEGEFLLERRPSQGIWGGLWSFPECRADEVTTCCISLGVSPESIEATTRHEPFRHTFTHFHLDITPVHVKLQKAPSLITESGQRYWYDPGHPAQIGLAAPVVRLINSYTRGATET
jgi:A/G-specific adenine glycosylase